MSGKFAQFFSQYKREASPSVSSIDIGDSPPPEVPSDAELVLLLSLTCTACVDMLPHVKQLQSVFGNRISIILDGSAEEIRELQRYFQLQLPLIEEKVFKLFYPPVVPYLYILDEDKRVAEHKKISTIDQILFYGNGKEVNSY